MTSLDAPSTSESILLSSRDAAVDLSTGFSADSFLFKEGTGPRKGPEAMRIVDPWNRRCFITLVDVAINHQHVFFPIPVPKNEEWDVDLPKLMESLGRFNVLSHPEKAVTRELEPTDEKLQVEFKNFRDWAKEPMNAQPLSEWLHRQFAIGRLGKDEPRFIIDFWEQNRSQVKELENLINQSTPLMFPVSAEELRYAFSVMFRAKDYYDVFMRTPNVKYFPHPLKLPLFQRDKKITSFKYRNEWSWGWLIAKLIDDGQIGRVADEVIGIVAILGDRVRGEEATWYDLAKSQPEEVKKREDLLASIAFESFPAPLKEKGVTIIKDVLRIGGAGIALIPPYGPFVTAVLEVASVAMEHFKGYVPGVGNLKICRGAFEWPTPPLDQQDFSLYIREFRQEY